MNKRRKDHICITYYFGIKKKSKNKKTLHSAKKSFDLKVLGSKVAVENNKKIKKKLKIEREYEDIHEWSMHGVLNSVLISFYI